MEPPTRPMLATNPPWRAFSKSAGRGISPSGTRAGMGDKKGGRRRRGSNGRPSGARVFEQYGRRCRGAGSIPPIDKGVLDGYHLPTFVLYMARHPCVP